MAQEDMKLTANSPPQQIIIQQPPTMFGRFGKWLLAALVLAVIFIIGLYNSYDSYFSPADAPIEKYHSLAKHALEKIAIIDVSGTIMEGEESFAKKQIDRVREDDSVKGIVVRINSPGGTVTGSDYLYHHLLALKAEKEKGSDPFPLVVSMGSICASGGYYVAMAVGNEKKAIFAEPTTWTGSIGVIIPHMDLSGALDSIGVEDDSIASGPLKQMGSPTRPMTEKEREVLQELVDESFQGFKAIVASGRPSFQEDPAKLNAVATGQIYTSKQALDRGLVDQIGFVEDAIKRAAELAGKTTDEVRCVKYEEPPSLIGSLVGTGASAPMGRGIDVGALIDLTVPRAYYLWSWLPAAISNSR
jgi:protease IV